MIGEGPQYTPILETAKSLVDEWIPWGIENSSNWWETGIGGIVRTEDGKNELVIGTLFNCKKTPTGIRRQFTIEDLRVAAISILVYCAAYEKEVIDDERR